MTTPSHGDGDGDGDAEPVGLSKAGSPGRDPSGAPGADVPPEPFDPYRFGRPEHPVPAEYAPPGYVPDPPVASSEPPGTYPPAQGWGNQPPAPQWGQPPPGPYPQYGQQHGQQYGQQPPGYPPPPYGQVKPGNGKATTALVLGIASIVFCWVFFFDVLLVVPAIVFGLIGLSQAKRTGGAGRGMAIAGLVCAVVGAILATVLSVLFINAANKCGGLGNSRDPGFQSCVQDRFR